MYIILRCLVPFYRVGRGNAKFDHNPHSLNCGKVRFFISSEAKKRFFCKCKGVETALPWVGLHLNASTKVGQRSGTCYSVSRMSQTRDQKFTISEVAADWHELMIPQRIMRPSIARVSEQLE